MSYNLYYLHRNIFDNENVSDATTVESFTAIDPPITDAYSIMDTTTENLKDFVTTLENVVSTPVYVAVEKPLLTTVPYATTMPAVTNGTVDNLAATLSTRLCFFFLFSKTFIFVLRLLDIFY